MQHRRAARAHLSKAALDGVRHGARIGQHLAVAARRLAHLGEIHAGREPRLKLSDRLRFALGTKVRLVRRRRGGTIEFEFGSEPELNRLYELLIAATSSRPSA